MILSSISSSAWRLQAEFSHTFGRTASHGSAILRANLWSPEVNCRPPWGSQMCDTVVDFIVCVEIASRIQSHVWTDNFTRERDSGANLWSPEVNCRPPWGSQMCDTVVEFCLRVDCHAGSQLTLDGQLRTGARFWRESLVPRSELQTPMG